MDESDKPKMNCFYCNGDPEGCKTAWTPKDKTRCTYFSTTADDIEEFYNAKAEGRPLDGVTLGTFLLEFIREEGLATEEEIEILFANYPTSSQQSASLL